MQIADTRPELIDSIWRYGFSVVDTPDSLEVPSLFRIWPEWDARAPHHSGLRYSLLSLCKESSRSLSHMVTEMFRTALETRLPNYRFLFGSALVKHGDTSQELELHQDWNYLDEGAHLPITCWMPLSDTGPGSGGMFVLPGSQSSGNAFRSNSYPTGRLPSALFRGRPGFQELSVPRGQILLFHPALWHGSAPNPTQHHRVVLTCAAVPKGAELWYCHRHSESSARVFRMTEHAYEDHLAELVNDSIPEAFIHLRDIVYSHGVEDSAMGPSARQVTVRQQKDLSGDKT
jgi:hypothetical protein